MTRDMLPMMAQEHLICPSRLTERKKRGLQGVPSETAEKIDFFKGNVTRNRAAIEVRKMKNHQKNKGTTYTLDSKSRTPPFRRLTCF